MDSYAYQFLQIASPCKENNTFNTDGVYGYCFWNGQRKEVIIQICATFLANIVNVEKHNTDKHNFKQQWIEP